MAKVDRIVPTSGKMAMRIYSDANNGNMMYHLAVTISGNVVAEILRTGDLDEIVAWLDAQHLNAAAKMVAEIE